MESLQSVIQFILNLGAAVFVPALMIIIGLIVRMKVRDAVSAGIILGVAFLGMNIVIGFMIEALTPAAQGLAERTGINLSIFRWRLDIDGNTCLGMAICLLDVPATTRY